MLKMGTPIFGTPVTFPSSNLGELLPESTGHGGHGLLRFWCLGQGPAAPLPRSWGSSPVFTWGCSHESH